MAKSVVKFHRSIELSIISGLLAVLTISCQPSTRKLDMNAMMNPDLANKLKEIEMTKTCDNQVNTVNLPKELMDNSQSIEAEIATKDLEHVDCKGNITWKGHGPEKALRQMVEVTTPITEETTKVNFIQIENTRTCTIQRISPADDAVFGEKEITLENGTKIPIQQYKTMANSKGNLKLMLTDSIFRTDANAMNVRDGANIIRIQYFGKCLKYGTTIEEKHDDAFNCETAELLKTKEIILNLKINRPEVSGTSQTVLCFDNQNKKTQ
jgi:hypothetical protein